MYSIELNKLMADSGGHVLMSKRFFWPMFKKAWDKAFTEENIQHAWEKARIWPTNGDAVIAAVTKPLNPSPKKALNGLKPPTSAKSIR